MRKTTLAIGSVLGILLLALMVACSGELDGVGSIAAPEGTGAPLESRSVDNDSETAFAGLDRATDLGGAPASQGVANLAVGGAEQAAPPIPQQFGGSPDTGGGAGSQLSGLLDRKIIRTATLDLTVEDVAGGMQEVERIANTAGGFVSGSSLSVINPGSEDEERRQTGTVTIRVPSAAYASVMNQLRGIATEIESESSDTSEVTAEYTDLESRLRTLEATEERYLELLTRADTIPDILTMEDRLNSVRFEIEQVLGRLNLLDDLSDLSTITVRLDLPPLIPETPPTENKGWAQKAWDESWATSGDTFEIVGTIGIAAAVTLLWLAIPGALAFAAWRAYERWRPDKGTA
ncbi:MAG: DUF4349 domain-containing protein [Chloroflexi bacterium]|nr:DUF4349 domain-containing protein [Chloroflexota bacterium]